MTLIESLDRNPLQNLAECLAIEPKRLILVGSTSQLDRETQRYRQLLAERHLGVTVIPQPVDTACFHKVTAVFEKLIETYSPCVIDLFGGDELQLVAAGAAFSRLNGRYDVALQKMDMKRGAVVRMDLDEPTVVAPQPKLSIRESVMLYGGKVFSQETQKLSPYTTADIDPLWNLARKNPEGWNKKLKALNFFERRNNCQNDELQAFVDLYRPGPNVTGLVQMRRHFQQILNELSQIGALTIEQKDQGQYQYRYASPLVRSCLKKEGNVLEYKTFLSARECLVDGEPLFCDSAIGVTLDWDGVLYNPYGPSTQDTRNEIDVLLLHGAVPIFLSCKNGTVKDEELYKLNTVSKQLGGAFAKKAILATDFEPPNEDTKLTTLQRAKDMDILFAPDVAQFTNDDWKHFFKDLVKG